VGIHYVNEMKRFLLQGQEDALVLTARAVGTVLNDREELFRPDTGVPELNRWPL
jgi:two-component system, OmpR family, sensor histidine kinase ChvG